MKQNNIEINDVVGKKILTYFKNGYSIRKISNLDNMPSYYKIIKFIKNNGLTVYNKAIERKFNSDEEELIIKRYTNGNISASKLSKEMGCSIGTVIKILREHHIMIINYQNVTKFNENKFDNIDTSEKAYWLGFIFADGYISSRDNEFELSLSIKDVEQLNKFNTFMEYNGNNVKIYENRCRWFITNKHLWNTLNNLGCTPRKSTTLEFPNIDNIFYKDFIRGYFDGDGYFTYNKVTVTPIVGFIGTEKFLTKLVEILSNNEIHSGKFVKDLRMKSNNIYIIRISVLDTNKFLEYLYMDSKIYLNRKFKRYEFFRQSRSSEELLDFLANENGEG